MTILSILEIVIGVVIADGLIMLFEYYRNKRRTNLLCDMCKKPRKLHRTFDKQLWLCRNCNKLYIEEYKNKTKGT